MVSLLPSSRALRLTFAAIGAALAAHALHAVFGLGGRGLDGFFKDGLYMAIELVALGACLARVLQRARDRGAWGLICLGLAAWAGGDLVFTVWLENLSNPPYPSLGDALYLA